MGWFNFFGKRKIKNLTAVLALVASLSIPIKTRALDSAEVVQDFKQTVATYVERDTSAKSTVQFRKELNEFVDRLEISVNKDIDKKEFSNTLNLLNNIHDFLVETNKDLDNFFGLQQQRVEALITRVSVSIENLKDKDKKDVKIIEALDGIEDKDVVNLEGVFKHHGNVYVIVNKTINKNLQRAQSNAQTEAAFSLLKKLGYKGEARLVFPPMKFYQRIVDNRVVSVYKWWGVVVVNGEEIIPTDIVNNLPTLF